MPDYQPLVRAATLLAGTLLAMTAFALDAPQGKVILSLKGKIAQKNQGETAGFDLAMIESLPQHTFTTSSPWFDKPQRFTGPLLRDVLAAVKVRGSKIYAEAVNDYTIIIPVSDAVQYDVIVAHQINGKSLPVRDKGPLFVVYPFDSLAELRSSKFYERSIWQLKSLEIR